MAKTITQIIVAGQRYGYLTAIAPSRTIPSITSGNRRYNRRYWTLKCDCGTTKDILVDSLLKKHPTITCGCRMGRGVHKNTIKQVYVAYETHAKRRSYAFDLPMEQFTDLIHKDCYYCGAKPSNRIRRVTSAGLTYNGVDRVDNTCGYTTDNVVPCCRRCNRAKDTMTAEEYVSLCHAVAVRQCNQLLTQGAQQ